MPSQSLLKKYESNQNSVLFNRSLSPDYKNDLRYDPMQLLSETKDLIKNKDLSEQDLNILNGLKELILVKTRKQQDLGF